MKAKIQSTFYVLFLGILLSCNNDPSADIEQLDCEDYWSRLSLTSFCSMDLQVHFDTRGIEDLCNADANDALPSEDRIHVFVFNAYTHDQAMDEYEERRAQDESSDTFINITHVGDAAHAFLSWNTLGHIDHATFEIVKGQYGVHIEINFSPSGGNCLDENTMYDFARAVVEAL